MTPLEARNEVLAKLKGHHTQALAVLAEKFDDVDLATASSTKGQLAQVGWYIGRLAPTGDLAVGKVSSTGVTITHERWMAIAKQQWAQVAYSMKQFGLSEPTWHRFWDEVVVQTGRDISDGAKAALPSSPEVLGGLGIVAVILIALVVLKVT